MSQVKFGEGFIPKFDSFQDENTFKYMAQQNLAKQKDSGMSNPEEDNLVNEIKKLALLSEATIEAINYALVIGEEYNADDATNFLFAWNEGSWDYIVEHYQDFDINSEAQQTLIKESGSMPS